MKSVNPVKVRRFRIAIAVVFFIVAVLAMYNTWRLNEYVRQTLPRDAAQEQCVHNAVDTINLWIDGLSDVGVTYKKRDEAIIAIVRQDGTPPTPEELAALGDAVERASQVWEQYQKMVAQHPLVACAPPRGV